MSDQPRITDVQKARLEERVKCFVDQVLSHKADEGTSSPSALRDGVRRLFEGLDPQEMQYIARRVDLLQDDVLTSEYKRRIQ